MILLRKARRLHGRTTFQGMEISIENRRGSIRQWHDPHTGRSGITRMKLPYGYIRLTEGADGDHVDCFVGPNRQAPFAYIVNQMKSPEFTEFDEQKVMLGFDSARQAKQAYLDHYDDRRFFGSMKTVPMKEFKRKVFETRKQPSKLVKASFENAFSGMKASRKLTKEETVRAIRQMVASEYEAVQLYTQLAESITDQATAKVLRDVAEEEKVHAGEFLEVLRRLDPKEHERYREGAKEVSELIGKQ